MKKMNMKTYIYPIVIFFLFFASSCNDNETALSIEGIKGKWEAITFASLESVSYQKENNFNPIITFNEDGTYRLNLDRNSCGGSFTFSDQKNIEITVPGCTEICCDSDFSQKFANMLSKVSTFTINKDKTLLLHVDDWGFIILEKVK